MSVALINKSVEDLLHDFEINLSRDKTNDEYFLELVDSISCFANISLVNRETLGELGVCDLLVQAVNSALSKDDNDNLSDIEHFLECCCALCGYGRKNSESEFCTDNIDRLVHGGMSDTVVSCLKYYKSNSRVVAKGCKAIRVLAYGSHGDNFLNFAKSSPELPVIEAMTTCREDDEVCEAGCWALMSLAYDDAMSSKCGSLGACELIMDILNRYPHASGNVIAAACWAMRNLSASNRRNTDSFASMGVEETLLRILRHDTISELLFEGICAAIGGLCFNDNLSQSFGDAGACELIVHGLDQLADNVSIASVGCESIRNLSAGEGCEENIHRLMSCGASELLVRILIAHRHHAGVTVMASRALGNLALLSYYHQQLMDVGALMVIDEIADSNGEGSSQEMLDAREALANRMIHTEVSVTSAEATPTAHHPPLRQRAPMMNTSMKSFSRRFASGILEEDEESGGDEDRDDHLGDGDGGYFCEGEELDDERADASPTSEAKDSSATRSNHVKDCSCSNEESSEYDQGKSDDIDRKLHVHNSSEEKGGAASLASELKGSSEGKSLACSVKGVAQSAKSLRASGNASPLMSRLHQRSALDNSIQAYLDRRKKGKTMVGFGRTFNSLDVSSKSSGGFRGSGSGTSTPTSASNNGRVHTRKFRRMYHPK